MTDPGQATAKPGYTLGRWLFLRSLALVYLIAIVSLWVQIEGLVGSKGILPFADHLDWVRERTGADCYWKVPTLLWIGDSDAALHLLCGAGVLLSLLLLVGLAQLPVLFLLWAVYLSLVHAGQTFLSFQWDILLLETGFYALFLAPGGWRPRLPRSEPTPRRAGLWLVWLLFFKLMVLSGAVKPLSMDETWWNLTALDYHYWTQPIPTWTSWYAHQLPGWMQKISVALTYGIEIALPFLIFAGRYGRRVASLAAVSLMAAIAATGNYGFFNLLTAVLCLPLLDDAFLGRLLPRRLQATTPLGAAPPERPPSGPRRAGRLLPVALAAVLIGVSALTFVRELVRTAPRDLGGTTGALLEAGDRWLLGWGQPHVLRWTGPFRTISGYGLFRAMTTTRPEIVVEGSADGRTWLAYEFPWKPGDPGRRPRFVAPHMPRLDWQMWFAALNPRRAGPWLEGLMRGLLEGSPAVLGLLENNPFPETPPRYVRLVYYRYEFASPAERRKGLWWKRELSGMLTPPVSLVQLERPER